MSEDVAHISQLSDLMGFKPKLNADEWRARGDRPGASQVELELKEMKV